MASRKEVIHLYRCLMREGSKFSNYNFRMYSLRKIRDSFKEKKTVTDTKEIENLISVGKENLEVIRRQVIIDNIYKNEHLVIDKHI